MTYPTQGGLPVAGATRNAAGNVDSVFGRTGAVIAAKADYSIDQMGDVDTSTTPPDARNLLGWDGSNWTPESVLDSGTFV
jgi:hypothetical protein